MKFRGFPAGGTCQFWEGRNWIDVDFNSSIVQKLLSCNYDYDCEKFAVGCVSERRRSAEGTARDAFSFSKSTSKHSSSHRQSSVSQFRRRGISPVDRQTRNRCASLSKMRSGSEMSEAKDSTSAPLHESGSSADNVDPEDPPKAPPHPPPNSSTRQVHSQFDRVKFIFRNF